MEQTTPTARSGPYNRLADPSWTDPLDTSYSKAAGGRWNPPGAFGALYLNGSVRMARLQADHKLAGQPYGIEDLEPDEQHDLIEVDVAEVRVQNCVEDAALIAAGLPSSYPLDDAGTAVGHERCHPVGVAARATGLEGVACRSIAALGTNEEELAIFEPPASERVSITTRRSFRDWYLAQPRANP